MLVKLLTEHHLELLTLKGGCPGWSESTLSKMSNCLKSHAPAHILFTNQLLKPPTTNIEAKTVGTIYCLPGLNQC